MTNAIQRILISALVVYGANWLLGPTVMLWCISITIGIYSLIYLTKLSV